MDKAIELVEKFASEIGKTAQEAWPLLVAQEAFSSGIEALTFGVFAGIALLLAVVLGICAFIDREGDLFGVCLLFLLAALVLTFATAIASVGYFHPEASLIRDLLKR